MSVSVGQSGLRRYPVLSGLCFASLLGWFAVLLWRHGLLASPFHSLTMVPFYNTGQALHFVPLEVMLESGQVWRFITPAFLHFSFAHLAFNLAIAVEFGRRAEAVLGSGGFALLAILIMLVSNLTQYLIEPTPLFGGLSGLDYGLVGLVAVRRVRDTDLRWQASPALIAFLVVSMVLFSTGVGQLFGLQVANGAHWSGFVTGVLLGMLLPTTPGAAPRQRVG